jgi:hypothetical protein
MKAVGIAREGAHEGLKDFWDGSTSRLHGGDAADPAVIAGLDSAIPLRVAVVVQMDGITGTSRFARP